MGDDTSREGGLAMVGILLLETKFPQVVGDGGNPDTWPYPVVVEKAGGRSQASHQAETRNSGCGIKLSLA